MGELSPWHLLIVAAVFVLLFGAKKLPDAARSLGRSMRIFKSEVKAMQDDPAAQATVAAQPAPVPAALPATEQPAVAPAAAPVSTTKSA
jgi:sec-independent protein translocase protein TatA